MNETDTPRTQGQASSGDDGIMDALLGVGAAFVVGLSVVLPFASQISILRLNAHKLYLEVLPVFLPECLQNQPGEERLYRGDGGKSADHERGQVGNKSGSQVFHEDRDEESE